VKIMQEQHHYKTTPEQGWSGMLQVLDQAMPVATRQRRFIVFWWAAAAVSTAAIVALFVLLNNNAVQLPAMTKSDVKSNTPAFEKNVPENAASVPAENTNEPVAEKNHDNQIASSGNLKTTATATESARSLTNKSINSESPSSHSSKLVDYIEGEIPSYESTLIVETVAGGNENPSVDDHSNTTSPELIVDPRSSIDQFRMNEVLASLPLSELAALEYEEEIFDDIEPARIARFNSKKNLITPHISAGIIDGFENGIGVHGEVGVNINVLPRLSLTSNVGYNIYSPDATLIGCACYEEDFADTDGLLRNDLAYQGIGEYLPAETVFNSSGGSLNSFVSTIRQWQFTAGLKYDLSRRFFAEGGVGLGFGTTAHSAYPIITIDNSAPVSGDLLKISHSFGSVIKSNSTSAYAGIGYRLSSKAELYATATHSFDPYFLDNQSYGGVAASDRKDYIRGMNIGFRYNFQGP
jgi:hypothetical protein